MKKRQITALLAAILLFAVLSLSAAAQTQANTVVDVTDVISTDGYTFNGSTLMITNPYNYFTSDEDLAKEEATGAPKAASTTFINIDGKEASSAASASDNTEKASASNTTVVQAENAAQASEEYAAGAKKEIFTYPDDEILPMVCTAVGKHCTVWLRNITPDEADCTVQQFYISAERIANDFDAIYEAEVKAFGSPLSIDVDGDGKVAIMVYFGQNKDDPAGQFSTDYLSPDYNGMDMISVSENFLDTEERYNNFKFNLAHEFEHLINYAMTGDDAIYDSWLDEVFAQSAPAVCGLQYGAASTYTDRLVAFIRKYGYSIPFAFYGGYVYGGNKAEGIDIKEASHVYAQWYLFGQYIAGITEGIDGGGNDIYGAILKTGNCTDEALVAILYDMGVLSVPYDGGCFEELMRNYNLALFLQQDSGVYSFNGRDVTGFKWPVVLSAAPSTLRGGGATAFAVNESGSFTPSSERSMYMMYAGISEAAEQTSANETVSNTVDNFPLAATVVIGVLSAAWFAAVMIIQKRKAKKH